MRVLAIDRSDGWVFIRDGERTLLFRPPYRFSDALVVDESAVSRAVLHHGYSAFDRDLATWEEVAVLARAEVAAQCRAEGRQFPMEGVGRAMLRTAPAWIVARFLNRVRDELLPRGDFDAAEKILTALETEAPRLHETRALLEQATALLEQVRNGRAARFRALVQDETDELVRRWRNRDDWHVGELAASLVTSPPMESPTQTQWDAVGWALARAAKQLEDVADAKNVLRDLIARVYCRYQHADPYERGRELRDAYDRELIHQADAHGWPSWALDCLPSLYLVLDKGEPTRVLAWRGYFPPLWQSGREVELCGGEVLQVSLPSSQAMYVHVFAELGEPARLRNPYKSQASRRGIMVDVLEELRISLKLKGAGFFDESIRSLLEWHSHSTGREGSNLIQGSFDRVFEYGSSRGDSHRPGSVSFDPKPARHPLRDFPPHSLGSRDLPPQLDLVACDLQNSLRPGSGS